jgi:hypothetical protein
VTRRDRVVARLRDALATHDSGAVEAVLARRASVRSDDARPVMGAADVAATLVAQGATSLALQSVNGETAIVARTGTDVVAVYCLTVRRSRVIDVFVIREPPRLAHFNRVTDA